MNLLIIITGCLIANIALITILASVIYFFYRKNEKQINDTKNEIQTTLEKLKKIDVDSLTNSINTVSSSINSINQTINEIKEKLDSIKLPWG